jgi:uncharacterized protein (DUF433 family)
MEAIRYVEENQYGSIVIAGTGVQVSAVGFPHEDGSPEDELLERFSLKKEQLHGALAYFYGHREELMAQINKVSEQAQELSRESDTKMQKWRATLRK